MKKYYAPDLDAMARRKAAIEAPKWTQKAGNWMRYSAVALLMFLAIPFLFALAGVK